MGQFISAAAFKLRQSFSTSTDFIRIGSRMFIFDRRQWISAGGHSISAWTFNSLNSVTSVNKVHCVDFQCPLPYRGALCRYEATFAGVVSQLTTPMQSADLRWTDADSQWEKVYCIPNHTLRVLMPWFLVCYWEYINSREENKQKRGMETKKNEENKKGAWLFLGELLRELMHAFR